MQTTTRLGLSKLDKNDFPGNWHLYQNANFEAIDVSWQSLAEELVGSTTATIGGLKGTTASLVARLNNAMDAAGNIIFDGGDLGDSQHSRLTDTTKIHERFEYLEGDKMIAQKVSEETSYFDLFWRRDTINSKWDNTIPSGNRVRTGSGATVSYTSGTVVTVSDGWNAVLSGKSFYLTRPVLVDTGGAPTDEWHVRLASVNDTGTADLITVDSSAIRNSSNGVCGTGTASAGSSTFTATSIGVATAITAALNDHCLPVAGQTLIVYDGVGGSKEYTIKSVDSSDTVSIYGEFTDAYAAVAWEIVDRSQPYVQAMRVSSIQNEVLRFMATIGDPRYIILAKAVGSTTTIEYAISSPKSSVDRVMRVYGGGSGAGQFAAGYEDITVDLRSLDRIVDIVPYVVYQDDDGVQNFHVAYNPKRQITADISGIEIDPGVGTLHSFFLPTMSAHVYKDTCGASYNPVVDTGASVGTAVIRVEADPNYMTTGFCDNLGISTLYEWGVLVILA